MSTFKSTTQVEQCINRGHEWFGGTKSREIKKFQFGEKPCYPSSTKESGAGDCIHFLQTESAYKKTDDRVREQEIARAMQARQAPKHDELKSGSLKESESGKGSPLVSSVSSRPRAKPSTVDLTNEHSLQDSPAIHQQYAKTHRDFYPGEQRSHQYSSSFPGKSVVYGQTKAQAKGVQGEVHDMKKVIFGDGADSQTTHLVKKSIRDIQDRSDPEIGKTSPRSPKNPKALASDSVKVAGPTRPSVRVSAQPSKARSSRDSSGTAACLSFPNMTPSDAFPPKKSGLDSKSGNQLTFGTPSVSSGKAGDCLRPSIYEQYGISDEDYTKEMPVSELREIVSNITHNLDLTEQAISSCKATGPSIAKCIQFLASKRAST